MEHKYEKEEDKENGQGRKRTNSKIKKGMNMKVINHRNADKKRNHIKGGI